MLAGQDAHWLFIRLPGLRPDPQQLAVDLTLRHPRAVAVVNLQLEELEEFGTRRSSLLRLSSLDDLMRESFLCWFGVT